MEINSPHTLKYSINDDEDLELCIKALSSNDITTCILYFGTCQLSIDRLILLTEGLKFNTNLKALDLSFSIDFQYEVEPTTTNLLGKTIKELKSLESLRLRCFYGDISNIADFIKNSDTLKVLSISRACENDMLLIANALKINKNLTRLEVNDSGPKQGFQALAKAVTNHTNLKSIVLKSDCYYGNDFDILELLKPNQSLEKIVLPHHNHISSSKIKMHIKTQNDFEQALYFIEKSKNPRELELRLYEPCEISQTQQEQLVAKLNQLKGLQAVQLAGFSNINFISFYNQVLIGNSSIKQLTFRIKGNLNHQSAVLLADLIKNNSKLTSLSIGPTQGFIGRGRNLNPLSSDDTYLIFKALENNRSLIHVDLSGNTFGNIQYDAEDIAKVLKNNICLKSLNLEQAFNSDQYQSIAVQTVLAAVAENQTLRSLNISYNKALSSIFDNSLILLEKNTSLTELQILKKERSILQNYLHQDTCFKIEQIIKRNIKLHSWGLFQNYILLNYMSDFVLPKEVHNLIFNLTLADLGIEELARVSKTFTTDFKPSLQLTNVESTSNIEKKEVKILSNKIDNFKTIYKALYEGQSSLFKSWNSLADKADLTEAEICTYVKENPNSRSATAWQLALKYEIKADKDKLFKKTHHYAYSQSSSVFGLFKQSRFSENYVNLDTQISQAEQGSRTDTIAGILQSIK
jgi:hypothetical protein